MSETKWTPGPWKVGKDDPAVSYGSEDRLPEGWQLITGRCPPFAFGCCVAHVAEEADARLISAAPDMAEALARFDEIHNEGTFDLPDDTPITINVGTRQTFAGGLTLGDFRRARSALAKARGPL